ncbi:MAG: DUF6089 family protein [Ginsengibacter sp.]
MKKLVPLIIFALFFTVKTNAQSEYEYVQEGDFGITGGLAHYFGDINNRAAINRPKIAVGAYFRKQFGNYIAVRLTGHYAQLGYSDIYSKNEYQKRRNLSFNTKIFEIALMGDFNFFKFIPTDPHNSFTPYASLGIGVVSYDPYAFYNGDKIYLRPLNTEGQTFYKGRKAYGTMALCFPIAFGLKYALTDKINISAELGYRFTTTDYLDDVSSTYIGLDKFPAVSGKSIAGIMQDRSFETGVPIGIEGRQRGFSKQKDQYAIAEIGLSFNITSYRCPTAR